MIWLNRIFFVVNAALAAATMWALFRSTPGVSAGGIEYKDFISILLTAVTVVLAALAILLALAAVWGYQKLSDHAAERAAATAAAASQDYLNSEAFAGRVHTICAAQIHQTVWDTIASRVDVEGTGTPNGTARGPERPWQD